MESFARKGGDIMLLSIYKREYVMIQDKFKECIALMERDVAEFEKSLALP